jgi:mannose-6-phosphate isomerase-like protein (cupin superfamily)
MLKRSVLLSWIAVAGATMSAQNPPAQPQNTPPRPPATRGGPAVYVTAEQLAEAMKKSIEARGPDQSSAAITSTDQYQMSIVRRGKPAGAIAHTVGTELHYITEGAGTFVTGGTIVRHEGKPATIEGGVSRRVKVGDVVVIPENTPHWYKDVEGVVTYLEVRFNVPSR